MVCWARYALRNARWLRENPHQPPMMWATAQALVTLPVSLAGYRRLRPAARSAGRVSPALRPASGGVYYADAGHRGALLMGRRAMLEYCQPAAADGDPRPAYRLRNPAGLLYTFLLRQSLPPLLTLSGILLLVLGVVSAVRARPENRCAAAGGRKSSLASLRVFLAKRCI